MKQTVRKDIIITINWIKRCMANIDSIKFEAIVWLRLVYISNIVATMCKATMASRGSMQLSHNHQTHTINTIITIIIAITITIISTIIWHALACMRQSNMHMEGTNMGYTSACALLVYTTATARYIAGICIISRPTLRSVTTWTLPLKAWLPT